MAEFKFSCPHCDQHILVDEGYAGVQINCPSCQELIVVPATMPAEHPTFNPQPAEKKSGWRTALIISAIVLICAGFGVGGWYVYSRHKATMQNADVQVPMPTIAHAAGAQEILAKLQQAYTNLTSLNMTGTSVGIMDISAVTADDLNPNQSDDDRNATLKAAKIVRSVTNVTEVSIKLARPDLYQIEGVSKMAVGQIAGVNFTIAVWTAGGTNFVLLGKNFTTVEDRREAFLKTAAMGKLASAIPQLFFGEANTWAGTKNWGQTEDESLDGQDCYTLTAKVMGQKLKIWVSQTSCLILQSQITIGGALSDADINDAFDTPDMKANYTPEQLDRMKMQTKLKSAMMAKIHGNLTETYDDMQTNENLIAADFIYPVSRGVRLNSTPSKFGSNYVISADVTAPGATPVRH